MDMLDQALDSSGQDKANDSGGEEDVQLAQGEDLQEQTEIQISDATEGGEEVATIANVGGALTLDPSVQYQFRADTAQGQVTYRVVQVTHDGAPSEAQVVTAGGFPAGTQECISLPHAVIQSPFSNGGSPTSDGLTGETRFTYVPAVSTTGDIGPQTDVASGTATLGQVTTGADAGQFYVMMSPQDVLQGQRTIAPRTHTLSPRMEGARTGRDERRRATHNEVERRRRDKINNWIVQLSKLVPDCNVDHSKNGQVTNNSKGGILAKACEYITGLRTANARMGESLKDLEKLSVDVELLRQQCEELKQENVVLQSQLQQHGIVPTEMSGHNS